MIKKYYFITKFNILILKKYFMSIKTLNIIHLFYKQNYFYMFFDFDKVLCTNIL